MRAGRTDPKGARLLIAALRPTQWLHFVVLPAAGIRADVALLENVIAFGRGLTIAVLVLGFGYLLNAISDRDLDADRDKNPLAGAGAPALGQWIALSLLPTFAIAIATTAPSPVLIATMIALVSGTIYSVGPRLKARPGIGTLLNAGCFTPLLFVGVPSAQIPWTLFTLAGCFFVMLMQNQLIHEAVDATDDRRGRIRTTFLALGPRRTAWLMATAGLALFVISTRLLGVGFGFVLSAPFFIVAPLSVLRFGEHHEVMAKVRRAHRLASAIMGVVLFTVSLIY